MATKKTKNSDRTTDSAGRRSADRFLADIFSGKFPAPSPTPEALEKIRAADKEWKSMAESVGPPSIPDFVAFMHRYIPAYNAACRALYKQMCEECGQMFGLADRRADSARFHNDGCAGRARNRGRERVGNGRSAAENRAASFGEKVTRHMKKCPVCKVGGSCPTFEGLLTADQFALRQVTMFRPD